MKYFFIFLKWAGGIIAGFISGFFIALKLLAHSGSLELGFKHGDKINIGGKQEVLTYTFKEGAKFVVKQDGKRVFYGLSRDSFCKLFEDGKKLEEIKHVKGQSLK